MSYLNEMVKLRKAREALLSSSKQTALNLAITRSKINVRSRVSSLIWNHKPESWRTSNVGRLFLVLYSEDQKRLTAAKVVYERQLGEINVKLARKEVVIRALDARLRSRKLARGRLAKHGQQEAGRRSKLR